MGIQWAPLMNDTTGTSRNRHDMRIVTISGVTRSGTYCICCWKLVSYFPSLRSFIWRDERQRGALENIGYDTCWYIASRLFYLSTSYGGARLYRQQHEMLPFQLLSFHIALYRWEHLNIVTEWPRSCSWTWIAAMPTILSRQTWVIMIWMLSVRGRNESLQPENDALSHLTSVRVQLLMLKWITSIQHLGLYKYSELLGSSCYGQVYNRLHVKWTRAR